MRSTYWLLVLTLIIYNLFFSEANADYEALQIIGGNETKPDEYKYVVGVYFCEEDWCHCTGSIIGERFIVSAAHCFIENQVFGSGPARIVAGTNNLGNLRDSRRVEVEVEKVYVPAAYNDGTTDDIAVLKLKQNLHLQKNNLQKLRLPIKSHSTFAGKQAILLGFGTAKLTYTVKRNGTVEETQHPNNKLHSANVAILSNDQCNQQSLDSIICGRMIGNNGSKHYGGCSGDSGAPLVYKSQVLIGVFTSNFAACNERFDYGIYQRVKSYIDFIGNATNDNTNNILVKSFD